MFLSIEESNSSTLDSLLCVRASGGLGVALRLGQVARLELNYAIPLLARAKDHAAPGLQFGVGATFLWDIDTPKYTHLHAPSFCFLMKTAPKYTLPHFLLYNENGTQIHALTLFVILLKRHPNTRTYTHILCCTVKSARSGWHGHYTYRIHSLAHLCKNKGHALRRMPAHTFFLICTLYMH